MGEESLAALEAKWRKLSVEMNLAHADCVLRPDPDAKLYWKYRRIRDEYTEALRAWAHEKIIQEGYGE